MVALTKTITLHVTQARIDRARPGCSSCPPALALADRGFGAAVGDRGATVSIPGGVVHPYSPYSSQRFGQFAEYRLPRVGRELVRAFDAGERVAPASFRITRMGS